jgi:hypothetical protein
MGGSSHFDSPSDFPVPRPGYRASAFEDDRLVNLYFRLDFGAAAENAYASPMNP